MSFNEEFPGFELGIEIPHGFRDESWRNDLCPCFVNEDRRLALWVAERDPARREFPEAPRFLLTRLDGKGQHTNEVVLASEVWQEIEARIDAEPEAVAEWKEAT